MERLSGIDATFLYSEAGATMMHTLKVVIIKPGKGRGPVDSSLKRLRDVLSPRLSLLPRFRSRILEVPLGLHHPVWVPDPAFDIDHHLSRVTAAEPGGRRELDAEVARIAGTPMGRDRPLWEIWVVDGLKDGRVAYVTKLHHAVADGVASSAMLAAALGPQPHQRGADETSPPLPSKRRLLAEALGDQGGRFGQLPRLIGDTLRAGLKVRERIRRLPDLPRPFSSEQTRFNRKLTSSRTFATADLPMARFLEVKAAQQLSFNELLLAVVGEGVRAFLDSVGESPARSLLASVPVGVGDLSRVVGNGVSHVITTLGTSGRDMGERLDCVRRGSRAAMSAHEALGGVVMQQWAEFTPPGPYNWGYRAYANLALANVLTPPTNLIVSNVRGPASSLTIEGDHVDALYSVGPLLEGLGLNVTAWSYGDRLGLAVLADRSALPEAGALAQRFAPALAAIGQARVGS